LNPINTGVTGTTDSTGNVIWDTLGYTYDLKTAGVNFSQRSLSIKIEGQDINGYVTTTFDNISNVRVTRPVSADVYFNNNYVNNGPSAYPYVFLPTSQNINVVANIYDGDIIPQRVIDGFNIRWAANPINIITDNNSPIAFDPTTCVTTTVAGSSGRITTTLRANTTVAYYQVIPWFDLNGNDARAADGSEDLTTPIDVYVGSPSPASVTITGGTSTSLDVTWQVPASWPNLIDYYYVSVNGVNNNIITSVPGQLNYNLTLNGLTPSTSYTVAVTSAKTNNVIPLGTVIQSVATSAREVTSPNINGVNCVSVGPAGGPFVVTVTVNLSPVNTAVSYQYERRTMPAGAWTVLGSSASNVYVDPTSASLLASTTYQYRVTASNVTPATPSVAIGAVTTGP
jgi:hypothetical protein